MKTRKRCPVKACREVFTDPEEFRRHVQICTIEPGEHQCPVCLRNLATRQNLVQHMYKHTGEKPFKCRACGIRYRHGSQLSVHMRVHKEEEVKVREQEKEEIQQMTVPKVRINIVDGAIKHI